MFSQNRFLQSLSCLAILTSVLLSSCAKEKPKLNVSLSANRKMGVAIRSIKMSDGSKPTQNLQNYLMDLSGKAIQHTYSSTIVPINLTNTLLEVPDNLYEIGTKEIDDLFLFDVTLPIGFSPASANSPSVAAEETAAQVSGVIHNGSNLKAVNVFRFNVPSNHSEPFQALYEAAFKKSLMDAFPNPNIYPRAQPAYFANLLYVYSREKEKEAVDSLDCDNANEVLKYFPKANEIFKLAIAKGSQKIVGQQGELQQMGSRQQESEAMAKTIDECKQDLQSGFAIKFDYGKIGPESIPFIQKAFEIAEVEDLLRKYTVKPVHFRFQIEGSRDLSLFVELRFNRPQYLAWIRALKTPDQISQFRILSLDPYKALMQKLVAFRGSLPAGASGSLKSSFQNLRISVGLKTLINGDVAFGVDGRYLPEQKVVTMAYPNSVVLTAPAFPSKTITTKSNTIFQDKGWIALGNCKTLEGSVTEDGLVYKFFGFPCR